MVCHPHACLGASKLETPGGRRGGRSCHPGGRRPAISKVTGESLMISITICMYNYCMYNVYMYISFIHSSRCSGSS